jgi:NAD(P)H-nitrite reductase large subunit
VRLTDGTVVACDVILPLIGVEFPLAWVREAGIEVRRGILANEYLETNIPDVYTAGDTAEYRDLVLDEMVLMGDWMSARTQGELAGKNMLGERVALEQVTFHASHGFGFYLGWVGDTRLLAGRSAYTVVLSGEKPNQYARLITQDGVVKGGSVVNRPDLVLKITKLIRERKDMHPFLTDNATISEAVFA